MAASKVTHAITECPVCQENYTEPKILPCAHLLCRKCLVSWLQSNAFAKCPLCRSAIKERDIASSNSVDVADSLPTDHAMSAVVECSKLLAKQRVCSRHAGTAAVSLCLQCRIMLCKACVKYHKVFPVTSSHTVECLATLTPEKVAANRSTPCPAHLDKTAELFCSTHNEPICHVCASSKHRTCSDVKDLSEILAKYKQSFHQVESKLRELESDFNESLQKTEKYLTRSDEITRNAQTEVDILCDHLISLVEKCRIQHKKLLKDSDDRLKAVLRENKSYFAQNRGKITSHRILAQRVQQSAPGSMQGAMLSTLEDRIRNLDSERRKYLQRICNVSIAMPMLNGDVISGVDDCLQNVRRVESLSISIEYLNSWHFHSNHGKNIELNCTREIAELKGSFHGIVMSSEPMKVDTLYEVRVEEMCTGDDSGIAFVGVVTESPATLTLPFFAGDLKSAISIYNGYIYVNQKTIPKRCGQALYSVKAGSRVGVVVNAANFLHLYVDGKDQGVAHSGVSHPCFTMIDLYSTYKKIIALPLTSIQNGSSVNRSSRYKRFHNFKQKY